MRSPAPRSGRGKNADPVVLVRTVVISRGREPYGEGASDECRGRDTGPNAGPKTSGRRYVRWRDLTLNGNFPVAFEGGVASSSIRGGFAEKITSSVVRQRSNGALSERRRNGNRMGYDRLRLTPGARWICSYGASLARPTLRPAVTMVSLSLAGWILSRSKRQVRRPLDLRCLVRRSARPRRCGWQRGLMTGSRTVVE